MTSANADRSAALAPSFGDRMTISDSEVITLFGAAGMQVTLSVLDRVHHHRAISRVADHNNGFVFLAVTFKQEQEDCIRFWT